MADLSYRVPPFIPLVDALICVECNTVVEAPSNVCPRCASGPLASLQVWLDRKDAE